jgi:hypothetical protein
MTRVFISNDPSGHIFVSFQYNPLFVEKVKIIDGRRRHPVEKQWSFQTLHPHECEKNRKDKKPLDNLNLKGGGDCMRRG